ncbi:MAG TPA: prepilin-type N-terminal cleavage/methylation domain-containing protein [Verrucomicrobiae bacterium]|nr:prepilin-type N-terminal cleavage/methylation domain-containing protein [Verrucomicrobiae bacterium]
MKFISFHPDLATARARRAFSLVEILVVMAILSFIVVALMAVFNGTQKAFRAGLTQTDVLESGRVAMDLMRGDLETMTPSYMPSNAISSGFISNNINFYVIVTTNSSPLSPLFQNLAGSSQQRTNILEKFFILSRDNIKGSQSWVGTGYTVTNSPDGGWYSLYRFYETTNIITGTPASLYNNFTSIALTNSTFWSHLMDGVVHLRVRAFDTNGVWMNLPNWQNGQVATNNVLYFTYTPQFGETGFYMFSNMVPASVEIELGVLEDRALQHAESLNGASTAQNNYLTQQAGQIHLFRQRVPIRNVDPTAYQ